MKDLKICGSGDNKKKIITFFPTPGIASDIAQR